MVAVQDTQTSAFPKQPRCRCLAKKGMSSRRPLPGTPGQQEMGCGSSSGKNYSLRKHL